MPYARGKKSLAISDRSAQQFPYLEMVKEWNGSIVHTSEFEAKHPQLDPTNLRQSLVQTDSRILKMD